MTLNWRADQFGFYVQSPDKLGWMQVFNLELVKRIVEAYITDEYCDVEQHAARRETSIFDKQDVEEFVVRNLPHGPGVRVLDIGCGSGRSLDSGWFTDAVEPSWYRYLEAKKRQGVAGSVSPMVGIRWGVAEALPFSDGLFNAVMSIGSWHYLRSQLEGFCEVSRVLKVGGIFIVDLVSGKSFPYGGVTMDAESLLPLLRELGFSLREFRPLGQHVLGQYSWKYTGLVLEKVAPVDLACMKKLQLVKTSSGFQVRNFIESRDGWLL